MNSKPAVFLDRDGVIIPDTGYPGQVDEIRLLPGVASALSIFKRLGYWLFVVSNQSGIARGYFTCETVDLIHERINSLIVAEGGAAIDHFFYCPHLPAATLSQYQLDCSCRKPRPGMFLQAMDRYPIVMEDSFMVGDRWSDAEAASRLGLKCYQISPPYDAQVARVHSAAKQVGSLAEVATFISSNH